MQQTSSSLVHLGLHQISKAKPFLKKSTDLNVLLFFFIKIIVYQGVLLCTCVSLIPYKVACGAAGPGIAYSVDIVLKQGLKGLRAG